MNTGISLYFSNGLEKNEEIIKKAVDSGVEYAFTSLHIPEESGVDYRSDIRTLLEHCKRGGLQLIVDVGPETLEKLGVQSIEELVELGITHVRLDYGFTAEDTVRIAKLFHIVFNASTISEEDIRSWREAGADFTRFAACHNFYPKQFTALSIERVKEINLRLKNLGFTTMAFVPGNKELRGPLYEGLPTVEKHRSQKSEVQLNMLELYLDAYCDVVLVGDVDVYEDDWRDIACLSQNYVELKATVSPKYLFVKEGIHHDRPDSSEQVFRSQESREYKQNIEPENWMDREGSEETESEETESEETGSIESKKIESFERKCGSISISNRNYLRYMGELEIAREDLPEEKRVNIIGYVAESDRKYLPYIRNGLGIKLI